MSVYHQRQKKIIDEIWTKEEMEEYLKEVSQRRKEKNRKVYQKRKQEKKEKKDMIEKNRRINSVKELMCCGGYGLHKIDVLLTEFNHMNKK